MVCRARGARRPLFRRSQFHAGTALTARKALDASALAVRAARTNGATVAPTNKCLALINKSSASAHATNKRRALPAARRNSVANAFGLYIHETLRSPSCSRARFRRVGLACRARLHVAADIVLAKVRRNRLGMSLPGVRLQRRARLARSKWPVRVTR